MKINHLSSDYSLTLDEETWNNWFGTDEVGEKTARQMEKLGCEDIDWEAPEYVGFTTDADKDIAVLESDLKRIFAQQPA